MVVSPAIGFVVAFGLAIAIMYFLRNSKPQLVNGIFGRLQIGSSIFFSLTHGANDGQKTMGVITALLVAGGFLDSETFIVPIWVILGAAAAIAIGTFFRGMENSKDNGFQAHSITTIPGLLC
jgi:PiT family inorganic phosphate transporter